jgi:hypothetical protein
MTDHPEHGMGIGKQGELFSDPNRNFSIDELVFQFLHSGHTERLHPVPWLQGADSQRQNDAIIIHENRSVAIKTDGRSIDKIKMQTQIPFPQVYFARNIDVIGKGCDSCFSKMFRGSHRIMARLKNLS